MIRFFIYCLVSVVAVSSMDAVEMYEAVVDFDREAAQNIIHTIGEYQRKDYYIPIPVKFKQLGEKQTAPRDILIGDYNATPIYNKEKGRIELWGYEYNWGTGRQEKKTKYEIYGVEPRDIDTFFNRLPSLVGFEDIDKTASTTFSADTNYKERPPFFINNTRQLIIYTSDAKYVCPFEYITWDDRNYCIGSSRGAQPVIVSEAVYQEIKKAIAKAMDEQSELLKSAEQNPQFQPEEKKLFDQPSTGTKGSRNNSPVRGRSDGQQNTSSLANTILPSIVLAFLTLFRHNHKN